MRGSCGLLRLTELICMLETESTCFALHPARGRPGRCWSPSCCVAYRFSYAAVEHCLPPLCTNLFCQHLGSYIVMVKFAQLNVFFIPVDFLFLSAHFFSFALILFFPAVRGCCLLRNCVSLPRN